MSGKGLSERVRFFETVLPVSPEGGSYEYKGLVNTPLSLWPLKFSP